MDYSRIHKRTLQKAAQIMGGQAQLANYLHVGSEQLAAWMEGRNVLPRSLFISAVDLIELGPRSPAAYVRRS